MKFELWLAYFLACWVIAISPGAGAVLSMGHAQAYGVRKTSTTIMGLQVGLSILLLVAGLGVGTLLVTSSVAFTVVKVVGAIYLFWLGVTQWRILVAEDAGVESPEKKLPEMSALQRFVTGILTNVTNPKGIVFFAAVLPQFILPNQPIWSQLIVLLCTSVAIDAFVMHGYAFLGARAQRWLRDPRAQRTMNRVFGLALMLIGASLLWVKGNP